MPSSAKKGYVVLFSIVLLVAILLPFLLASFYCHPHSDDFMNADFFKEHGFWYSQVKWYYGWTGRFVSVALQGLLSPLHFNFYFGYKLFPFVTIIAFWASIFYLFNELFKEYIAKTNILLLSLLFCAYFFIFLPGLADGIYWFTSNLGYFVPMILFSPFIVMMLRIVNGTNRLKENVLFILLGILMIGSNELALIMVNSAVALALLYKFVTTKKNR